MSDDIARDRSPRSPNLPLQDAIEITRKLYQQTRTAAVKPEIAVKALGYTGTNGAAMTTLATLGQYGLIDRVNGSVLVTPLAIKIFHPVSSEQQQAAIREAAAMPKVFQELLTGFEDCSVDVICGHLIQNSFNPDRARKVAQVYIANRLFAKISSDHDIEPADQFVTSLPPTQAVTNQEGERKNVVPLNVESAPADKLELGGAVLAKYTIPLGANEATLVFSGQKLSPDDFDALIEYIDLFKRQFERASRAKTVE